MKRRICICILILIFFMLFFDTVCIAYADNSLNSKLTIFLSGDIIEKIQVSVEFKNDEPIIFAVPCSITNYNIEYDEKSFLFGFRSYGNYSLCIVAPVGKADHFNIDISNEHNEIYEGITLKGIVTNGEYEMQLNIPIVKQETQMEHYIYQFMTYSIVQVHPYSSITYSEDGRKVLTEERTGEELLLSISTEEKDNIVYVYSMKRTIQEDSSSAFLIITSTIIPLLICILQLLYPDDNKKKVFSFRNIILYLVVLCLMGYAIYLSSTKDVPKWAFVITLLVFIFCIVCIIIKIVPSITKDEIKKNIRKFKLKKEKHTSELSISQDVTDESKTK